MKTPSAPSAPRCSAEEVDEAAVWIARLHGPERSLRMEAAFRRWLAAKPAHAAAFDTVSGAWELAGTMGRAPAPRVSRWERAGFRRGFIGATAAVCAVALFVIIGVAVYMNNAGVSTGVGEQRTLSLEDGTRITLNTSSTVRVSYDRSARRVELKRGEAIFEVAPQAARPFTVIARDREIRALGTAFVVRNESKQVSVTLLEGKVEVTSANDARRFNEPPHDGGADTKERANSRAVTLKPGERLTLAASAPARLDLPAVDRVVAWRHGHIEFDDTPLVEAITEVNRYSALQIQIEQADAAGIRINGVFRAGDTSGFAAAVAHSYGLIAETRDKKVVLHASASGRAISDR